MKRIFKQDEYKEYGFGSRVVDINQRLMNRDGSSNVQRKGLPFEQYRNIYHSLITMPWWKFNLMILTFYLLVNLLFALIYFIIDINDLQGMVYHTPLQKFFEAFFFSAQSLTTVGYGRINPVGIFDSTIAAIESMMGLLGFAMATGLLYGRFSRPVANILFSKNALIAPYKEASGLMIRIANKNRSELVDADATIILTHVEGEGENKARKFANLKLELTKVTLLSMSWTIVHPIDEESPIYNWTKDDFRKKDVEILVLIRAYEETFAQTVHARSSFRFHEFVFGAKFNSMVNLNRNGEIIVELDKINDHSKVEIEQASEKLA